jgi:mono/diheme cytochrome c family protein
MSDPKHNTEEPKQLGTYALLAEYHDPDELIAAANAVRERGFERWDTFSPFPVHGIDGAMGIKRTRLPWAVLAMALTGGTTALVVQWWTNAVDYKYITSGKPFWSVAANIPIAFELTVLFSALTAFFGMLIANGLPKPSSPFDRIRHFARSTDDRFFLAIEAADPKYDEADTRKLLESTKPATIEAVPEDGRSDKLPAGLVYGVLIAIAFSLVPFGLFANARVSKSEHPQWHVVFNMDFQQKFKAQAVNPFFSDKRAMREPVKGTVAVGALRDDPHFFEGKVDGAFATTLPSRVEVSEATMARGAERFGIYCAPCHGLTGDGDGMVHRRAFALKEGTWVKPANVSDPKIAEKPAGELYDTIANGKANMPAYARQISPDDRWAIVLYVRALQRSQGQLAAQASPAAQP